MSLETGSIVEGVVTGITNFGVFVQLPGGKTGLVHISEIANTYVKNINDFLQVKDKVRARVLSVDKSGKIGLSIKQVDIPSGQSQDKFKKRVPSPRPTPARPLNKPIKMGFEDKLSKFFKDSEERQQELKRNTEAKRGGRGGFRQEAW